MVELDDLAGKIQAILSDEESLRQIKELAGMFSSGVPPLSNVPPVDGGGQSDNAWNTANTESGGGNIGNGSGGTDFSSVLGGMNIGAIASLMNTFTESDKNSELLIALRPHLSGERQERVDKAVRALKLYNVYISLKENGMLEGIL